MPLHGHLWTVRPFLRHQLSPKAPPPSEPWSTTVEDQDVGLLRLHGRFSPRRGARACLVVVHGLGGTVDSHYMIDAARAAAPHPLAVLRLNLRGAGGQGEDFYNAGLTADVHAALRSPALAPFEDLYLMGYSMGGHIVLRCATEPLDPRVRAVAAICPPLDLSRGARAIDEPQRWVYRRHILSALKNMYAAISARRRFPVSVAEANRIGLLRQWDERIVAPRFGFSSAEAYYAAAAVGPRLGLLSVPSLIAAAEADPMILAETLRPSLAAPLPRLSVRWLGEGGHVGFPGSLALGVPGPLGLEPQALAWLLRAAPGDPSAA